MNIGDSSSMKDDSAMLVSVLMPCYNSARTLPMALASLLAQTYENWECVLVDDGSTDHPESVVEAAADRRIRYIRLERNMGRGFARQVTLEEAQGEFIAFLDADDWMYPWRLARQVEVMSAHPDLAVLSAGMAIVDPGGAIRGVRGAVETGGGILLRKGLRRPGTAPVPFAASIIRQEVAREVRFDVEFKLGEDTEFLTRALAGRPYGLVDEVLYAYAEHASVDFAKVAESSRLEAKRYLGYREGYPLLSRLRWLQCWGKICAYWSLDKAGLWAWTIARRSRKPTAVETARFQEARAAVERKAERMFGARVAAVQ